MGLGFLAGFGLATLGLLAVAALIGLGAWLHASLDSLERHESWHDSGAAVVMLFVGAVAYVMAIVSLSLPPGTLA